MDGKRITLRWYEKIQILDNDEFQYKADITQRKDILTEGRFRLVKGTNESQEILCLFQEIGKPKDVIDALEIKLSRS